MPKSQLTILRRIERKTLKDDSPNGCWIWMGAMSQSGYGILIVEGKYNAIHRLSYRIHHGDPPPDKPLVCHACDNPCCWRPDHLWAGSIQDNNADKTRKGRAASMKGEENPYSKLTDDQVRAIRAETCYQYVTAERFGITQAAVSLIKRRQAWKHVLP